MLPAILILPSAALFFLCVLVVILQVIFALKGKSWWVRLLPLLGLLVFLAFYLTPYFLVGTEIAWHVALLYAAFLLGSDGVAWLLFLFFGSRRLAPFREKLRQMLRNGDEDDE